MPKPIITTGDFNSHNMAHGDIEKNRQQKERI